MRGMMLKCSFGKFWSRNGFSPHGQKEGKMKLKKISKTQWKKIEKIWLKNLSDNAWSSKSSPCWLDGSYGMREVLSYKNKPMIAIDIANNRSKSAVYIIES